MAQTMIDTVPTLAEIMGDFSQSGNNIYDPSSSHPNPAFDPTKPVSPANPQFIRDQFQDSGVNNVIPDNRINPVAQEFLMKYVPMPNADMMTGMDTMPCGSAMMGAPTVVGAGTDCNNYFDIRNERHFNDQGTVRIDHMFERGDSLTARYSAAANTALLPGKWFPDWVPCSRGLVPSMTTSRSRAALPGTGLSTLAS